MRTGGVVITVETEDGGGNTRLGTGSGVLISMDSGSQRVGIGEHSLTGGGRTFLGCSTTSISVCRLASAGFGGVVVWSVTSARAASRFDCLARNPAFRCSGVSNFRT